MATAKGKKPVVSRQKTAEGWSRKQVEAVVRETRKGAKKGEPVDFQKDLPEGTESKASDPEPPDLEAAGYRRGLETALRVADQHAHMNGRYVARELRKLLAGA